MTPEQTQQVLDVLQQEVYKSVQELTKTSVSVEIQENNLKETKAYQTTLNQKLDALNTQIRNLQRDEAWKASQESSKE